VNAREAAGHLAAMKRAALEAGAVLMRRYGQLEKSHIESKSLNDFVTVVDRQCQDLVIRVLRSAFPGYGFRAEEKGVHEERERMWVIDPLDGTANYIHQFPFFCVSIGLVERGSPVCGLVYDPVHRETFTAVRGGGAALNGRRIRVSGVRRLADAFVATGFPYRMRRYFEPYNRSLRRLFYRCSGIRRGGSAALDLCYTACGRMDGFWEFGLSVWDVAAGGLIVEEAGGAVTDFGGRPDYLARGDVVAGTPAVQAAIVRVLKGIRGFERPRAARA
jgi:myo-inositol-1(or 4)-monophosphatase